METLWRVSTNSGQDRDASLISRILGRERSRQQSEIFNERRATCFGTRETFYSAQKQKSLSNEEKAFRPPVRRRSSAYDRYLTDIRDMICARCGGTRIPNKNINCTCQGSEGRRAARGEREREIEKDDQLDSRQGPTWYECACVYAHIHRLTRQCNLKRVRLAVATRVQEGKTRIFQSGGVRGREKRRRGGMRGSEKEREEVE